MSQNLATLAITDKQLAAALPGLPLMGPRS